MGPSWDPYAILGVAHSADDVTIRAAYRLRALENHPDRPGGSTVRMQWVTGAYATLSDPVKRAAWDRELDRAAASSAPPTSPSTGCTSQAAASRDASQHRGKPDFKSTRASNGCARSGPDPQSPISKREWRLNQWCATVIAICGFQALTVGGDSALLNAAAVTLTFSVFMGGRRAKEPFWPRRDMWHFVQSAVALVKANA